MTGYYTKREAFEVLGIPETSTPEEIRKAKNTLLKKFHPDAFTEENAKELAEEKTVAINLAFDTINSRNYKPDNSSYSYQQQSSQDSGSAQSYANTTAYEDIKKKAWKDFCERKKNGSSYATEKDIDIKDDDDDDEFMDKAVDEVYNDTVRSGLCKYAPMTKLWCKVVHTCVFAYIAWCIYVLSNTYDDLWPYVMRYCIPTVIALACMCFVPKRKPLTNDSTFFIGPIMAIIRYIASMISYIAYFVILICIIIIVVKIAKHTGGWKIPVEIIMLLTQINMLMSELNLIMPPTGLD